MNFIEKEKIEALVWKMQESNKGGFVVVDVCPKCGKEVIAKTMITIREEIKEEEEI